MSTPDMPAHNLAIATANLVTGQNVIINTGNDATLRGVNVTGDTIEMNIGGNLTLSTKELEYKDLEDIYTTDNSGFGLSTGTGYNWGTTDGNNYIATSTDQRETSLHPAGQTTVTLQNTGSIKEQTTKATIGQGNIIVNGEYHADPDLNRDMNSTQIVTQDKITGALDGTLTLDNRWITEGGRK